MIWRDQSLQKNPTNELNLLCDHMAARVNMKHWRARQSTLRWYPQFETFYLCSIYDSTNWSCSWKIMVCHVLRRLSVARENTGFFFSIHFYKLSERQLFDSYLILVCVALLKLVGLRSSAFIYQFVGCFSLPQNVIWLPWQRKRMLVFIFKLSAVRFYSCKECYIFFLSFKCMIKELLILVKNLCYIS